jgi:excisionase family DNA binding protein
MSGYLSLEEAAKRLGVEYKTVYFLVRSGEIPAGRIGRVYRIREEDLEAYFECQKELVAGQARRPGARAEEGPRCCSCGRAILSELSIGGRCEATGREICLACWSINKVRRCVPDAPAAQAAEQAGGAGDEGEPMGQDRGAGRLGVDGGTAAPAAAAPAETVEETIERLRREGRAVVVAGEARGIEENFLRSFGRRLEEVEELPDCLTGRAILLRSARVKHEIEVLSQGDSRLPGNRVSRFTLKTGGWGKPAAQLVLECRFLCRPETLAERGYDCEPILASELTAVLNGLSDRAAKAECFHVALLGSPTGWADLAVAAVAGGHGVGAFRDRRAAAALWDLHGDRVILDPADERLWAFWPLVAPAEFADKVIACAAAVRDILLRRNSLSLKDAARTCQADESWVRAAFDQLKRGGEFTTDQLPELGLVISRAST